MGRRLRGLCGLSSGLKGKPFLTTEKAGKGRKRDLGRCAGRARAFCHEGNTKKGGFRAKPFLPRKGPEKGRKGNLGRCAGRARGF